MLAIVGGRFGPSTKHHRADVVLAALPQLPPSVAQLPVGLVLLLLLSLVGSKHEATTQPYWCCPAAT